MALLGYTHAELLDEVVDAFGAGDAAAAFAAVDRVVQTGQDPRRFVDDLLERLRDLIVVAATGQGAAAVLRGVSGRRTRAHDAPGRRLRVAAAVAHRRSRHRDARRHDRRDVAAAAARTHGRPCARADRAPRHPALPLPSRRLRLSVAAPGAQPRPRRPLPAASCERPHAGSRARRGSTGAHADASRSPSPRVRRRPRAGPITLQHMRDAWPEVLGSLETISRSSWLLASGARVVDLDGDVLTLAFQSQSDVAKFKKLSAGAGPSEDLRQAILAVLGIRVKYLAKHDGERGPDARPRRRRPRRRRIRPRADAIAPRRSRHAPRRSRTGDRMGGRGDPERRRRAAGRRARAADRGGPVRRRRRARRRGRPCARPRRHARAAARGRCAAGARRRALRRLRRR